MPGKQFEPAYLRTHQEGRLQPKVDQALAMLRSCQACPRACRVNRLENQTGACRTGRQARVASAFRHFGEEDCLRGRNGSGTIFFAWCNLRCVFCQNAEISQQGEGEDLPASALASIMLELQQAGAHNINLVTPEHVVPQVLEALPLAIEGGLRVPLVYNTSAYDSLDSIRLLDGIVDIYMPDFKLWSPAHCEKYLQARDYAETARRAIKAMHDQVGDLCVDEQGVAVRGLLVRHLVMPGLLEDTRAILRFLAREISPHTCLNLMDQYRPAWKVLTDERHKQINRRIHRREMEEALEFWEHVREECDV